MVDRRDEIESYLETEARVLRNRGPSIAVLW